MKTFAERLLQFSSKKKSAVCVGLDPRLAWLPPEYLGETSSAASPRTVMGQALERFCREVIDLVVPFAVAVKPQSAFFELWGPPGTKAFEETCRHAREKGLLVIADVKRGDIGTTAQAYAKAYLASREGRASLCDACTVNPYLGSDGIDPFLTMAVRERGGVFSLVKTSNPSGVELQDLNVGEHPLYLEVARIVHTLNAPYVDSSGYGPLGAVVGATCGPVLEELRLKLAGSILLVPGFGAQGAGPEDVQGAFDSQGGGALISASRSITFPWRQEKHVPEDWRQRIQEAAASMREAVERVRGGSS